MTAILYCSFQILTKLSESDPSTNDLRVKSCIIEPSKTLGHSQDSSSDLLAERKMVQVLKDVCSIHNDLCDTCMIAEEYFALKMLTIVGIGFLIIVFNLYYVMEIAFGQIPDEFAAESYKFLIFLMFQVLMNIMGILCIIHSSCAITNEVKISFFLLYLPYFISSHFFGYSNCRTKSVPFWCINY